MSKPLRVGVIGTGWGQLQVEAFNRVKGIEVAAVCDVDGVRREKLAQQYKIANQFANYHDLIASDVDWVSIAAPPEMHAEMARAAIGAGKHVLTEKPLALNPRAARELLDLAAAKGIVHAMDFEMRYLPAHAYVKELVEEDYVGQLFRADVTMTMARPWGEHGNWAIEDARGGGVLMELGTNFIDLLRWWFGDISGVLAGKRTHFPSVRLPGTKEKGNGKAIRQAVTTDDSFWCVLQFARGGEALLSFVTGARHDPGWSIGLYGQTGSFVISSGQLMAMREGDREMGLLPIPKRLELGASPNDPLMWATAKLIERVAAKINRVPEALPFPDFGDGIASLQIVDAIRRSSEERCWVTVE